MHQQRSPEVERYITIARQRVEAADVLSQVRDAQMRRLGTLQIPVPDDDFDAIGSDFEVASDQTPLPTAVGGHQASGRTASSGSVDSSHGDSSGTFSDQQLPPPRVCKDDSGSTVDSHLFHGGDAAWSHWTPQSFLVSLPDSLEPEPQLQTELEWEAQLRQGGIGRVDDPDGEGGRDEDPNDGALPLPQLSFSDSSRITQATE